MAHGVVRHFSINRVVVWGDHDLNFSENEHCKNKKIAFLSDWIWYYQTKTATFDQNTV